MRVLFGIQLDTETGILNWERCDLSRLCYICLLIFPVSFAKILIDRMYSCYHRLYHSRSCEDHYRRFVPQKSFHFRP